MVTFFLTASLLTSYIKSSSICTTEAEAKATAKASTIQRSLNQLEHYTKQSKKQRDNGKEEKGL